MGILKKKERLVRRVFGLMILYFFFSSNAFAVDDYDNLVKENACILLSYAAKDIMSLRQQHYPLTEVFKVINGESKDKTDLTISIQRIKEFAKELSKNDDDYDIDNDDFYNGLKSLLKSFAVSAFESPVSLTNDNKTIAINDFENKKFVECLKDKF